MNAVTKAPPMKDRIRGLDGLRAIAVALVLIMHKTEFGTSARVGFYGVWLFFLLSGYLITGQLNASQNRIEAGGSSRQSELMSFWSRRALRIFPAYYAVLALVSLYYFLSGRELHGTLYYLLHLSNIYLSYNMEQFHTTWAHFWSLAVEEQFYLLFAPLLILTPRRHAFTLCLIVIAFSVLQRVILTAQGVDSFQIYIDSLVNVGLLAAGGILYLKSNRIIPWMTKAGLDSGTAGWIGLATFVALSASTTLLFSERPAALQTSYVVGGGVALFVLANVVSGQANSLVRVLELSVLAAVGRLSYSIYLINDYVPSDIPQRILALAVHRGFLEHGPDLLSNHPQLAAMISLGSLLLCFALAVGGAFLLWTFVEQPFLLMRDQMSGRTAPRRPPTSRPDPARHVANVTADT
jgi:peptidoglycan/LPS O-acetylase OafA/YrhL